MSTPTNFYQLTTSHRAVQSKKRAQQTQIKQIIFDEDNRREFLTGFHKRKVARTEAARAKAKEKEKADRLEARRQRRHALQEQAVENAVQVEKACGAISSHNDEEWHGITSRSAEANRDEEYENDEVLATVTVVEDFDPDIMIHGPSHPTSRRKLLPEPEPQSANSSHPNPKSKIYYETKHARGKERTKQHARKLEKAERAASKNSRLRKRKP